MFLLSSYEHKWKERRASEDVPIWNGEAPRLKLPHLAVGNAEAEGVIDCQAGVFEDAKEYLLEKFRVWE